MSIVQNKVLRLILLTLGYSSLGLGFLGIFLPLLPTTPFLILSAWCFVKSSAKAHVWLYRQPMLGKILSEWELKRTIPRSAKVTAIFMIAVSMLVLWGGSLILWLNILVTAILICVSIFILKH